MDYKKLGLKVGLEIHQQLNTKKLFCNCSSSMKENKLIYEVERKLRPVVGELGELDRAALFEFFRNRSFIYHGYENEACLVELDEEPPHQINKEALETALSIALILGLQIPNELWIMRKLVLDGSAITSFQRTVLVGFGSAKLNGVRIKTLCLEEDAAKPEKKEGNRVFYSLSRLGIPLVEIGTEPDIHSPKQCKELAETIGLILRSFNVKRGIGTIRQDVNISIKGGARVEIKGWQDLWTIDKLVENEVKRQLSLLEIRDGLRKKRIKFDKEPVNVKKLLNMNVDAFAIKLPFFKDVWKKKLYGDKHDKTLRDEIFEYAYAYNSFIFDDENLGEDAERIKEFLKASNNDIVLLIYGGESKRAAETILKRASYCLIGVPEETRKPNADATTSYARPLPGAARMYPETDHPPIKIDREYVRKLKKNLPKTLVERKKELEKMISKELASQIVKSKYFDLFEKIVKKNEKKEFVTIVATTFTSTLKDLRRSGLNVEILKEDDFIKIFDALKKGKISKKAIPEILKKIIEGEKIEEAIEEFKKIDKKTLRKILKDIVNENKGKSISALMGIAMGKLKGRADGKEVMEELKKLLGII